MKGPLQFLFTRFNLRIPGQEVNIDTWTEERFKLFELYTLPSVLGQVNKKFHWVLFFDSHTIPKHQNKIEALIAPYAHVHVRYFNGYDAFQKGWRKSIRNLIPQDCKIITTTGLDNDDAIHQQFTQMVLSHANLVVPRAINFENGLLLQHQLFAGLLSARQKSNAFITIIDRVEKHKFQAVYDKKHKHWIKMTFYKSVITEEPMWLQVIHDNNLANIPIGIQCTQWNLLNNFQITHSKMRKVRNTGLYRIKHWSKALKYWFYKLRGKV